VQPCEGLRSVEQSDMTIDRVEAIAPGALILPGGFRDDRWADLPAFCRVVATLRPSSDSAIAVEVWLPAAWNGKYLAVGNGGWAGSIDYREMSDALMKGYATSGTDTGHAGGWGASFALGHPEKLIDFAHRAVHEMAVKTKRIIEAFYGDPARHSYWSSCSTGGRQGLVEAQQFPEDFDGIVAVAPAFSQAHLNIWYIWANRAMLDDPASFIPRTKFSLIHDAVLQACDAEDGIVDRVLDDPRQCTFDPGVLQCSAGMDQSTCLTPSQVETVRKYYAGPVNPRTLEQVAPGVEPGSELGWSNRGLGPTASSLGDTYFKFVVFEDTTWDFRTFDFDRDTARALKIDDGLLAATDPDLTEFAARGGKLMLVHGWSDDAISPRYSIDYYESVADHMGGADQANEFLRLFLAPGMSHCGGGEGPNTFDALPLMERWVEDGTAPDRMIASHATNGRIDRTRPLCPYPQVARYRGTGSTDEAANFACVDPGT